MSMHVPWCKSFFNFFASLCTDQNLPTAAKGLIKENKYNIPVCAIGYEKASSWVNLYTAAGYYAQYKMIQKTSKMIETLANGYSSESTE